VLIAPLTGSLILSHIDGFYDGLRTALLAGYLVGCHFGSFTFLPLVDVFATYPVAGSPDKLLKRGADDKASKRPRHEGHANSGKQRVICTSVTRNAPRKCWVMAYFPVCRPDYMTDCMTDCTHFLCSTSAFPADRSRDDSLDYSSDYSSDCSHFLLSSTAFPTARSWDASSDCSSDCLSVLIGLCVGLLVGVDTLLQRSR